MVKENLNSRSRLVKNGSKKVMGERLKTRSPITLHPASAAITDQRVCGYYIRYTEGAIILVKITF